MPIDYSTQRHLQANAQRFGVASLVIVVRIAQDILKFSWRFIQDMFKSIIGRS